MAEVLKIMTRNHSLIFKCCKQPLVTFLFLKHNLKKITLPVKATNLSFVLVARDLNWLCHSASLADPVSFPVPHLSAPVLALMISSSLKPSSCLCQWVLIWSGSVPPFSRLLVYQLFGLCEFSVGPCFNYYPAFALGSWSLRFFLHAERSFSLSCGVDFITKFLLL